MHIDRDVFAHMDRPVEQGHGKSDGSDCTRDKARSSALSLAETVELLVLGAHAGAPRR